jgi:integrase
MKHNQLTTRKIAAATKPGYYGDGAGLYLQISKFGTKSWIFRYMANGRNRDMGLGPLCDFTLAEVRERAHKLRQQIKDGLDPIDERRDAKLARQQAALREAASRMSFADCAASYLTEHAPTWRNDKHRGQWADSLARANKVFGDLSVDAVDVDVLMKFLNPIWQTTPETASRIRGRIEKVLDWAKARKFRFGENPARWRGHLEHLLKAKPKEGHHAALPWQELPAFMQELRARDSLSARALEFCILTACRSGEVRGATWQEIDFDTKVWTVPGERTKSGRIHRVPLSESAIKLLSTLPQSNEFVFPSTIPGQCLGRNVMIDLLKGMNGGGLTVHGFRSTFSDWARDRTAYPRDVVEQALAHAIKDKSEAAYRRGDALDKRRRLMQDWSRYCSSPVVVASKVVALHAQA